MSNEKISANLRNDGRFGKGNRVRKGTKNPNAGRPKSDIREFFKDLCEKNQIAEKLMALATESTSEEIRIKASVYLLDRAYGKPQQPLEHSGSITLEDLVSEVPKRDKQ